MNKSKITFYIIALFYIILAYSCNSEDNTSKKNKLENKTEVEVNDINPLTLNIDKPKNNNYIFGDKIKISVTVKNGFNKDSVILLINNKNVAFLTKETKTFIWDTKNAHTGRNNIEIELNTNNQRFRKQQFVTIFSDEIPEEYTFKIKNVYKHDVNAYTQGLFYHDGFLYEATGLKGKSTVRKVKLETGEVLRSFAIPKDVFGEGITLYNNKIIQISWESGRGFVYDFNTFKHLDEFTYSGEGWGITNDDKHLFMTDGSSEVKILEPDTYSVTGTYDVYDNKGPVKYLNELEYINGYIYANIYQYEKIVKFDPHTGKVAAYIDLSHILPMNDYKPDTDVLNGIAYDKKNKRLFVTGKLWPKLFEIELIKK